MQIGSNGLHCPSGLHALCGCGISRFNSTPNLTVKGLQSFSLGEKPGQSRRKVSNKGISCRSIDNLRNFGIRTPHTAPRLLETNPLYQLVGFIFVDPFYLYRTDVTAIASW